MKRPWGRSRLKDQQAIDTGAEGWSMGGSSWRQVGTLRGPWAKGYSKPAPPLPSTSENTLLLLSKLGMQLARRVGLSDFRSEKTEEVGVDMVFHFTDENTGAWGGLVVCEGSPRQEVTQARPLRSQNPRSRTEVSAGKPGACGGLL